MATVLVKREVSLLKDSHFSDLWQISVCKDQIYLQI
jgi:hypothetical protein